MPNTKSAAKRLRQNKARRTRNRSIKSAVRTQLRKVREAIKAGEVDQAESEIASRPKNSTKPPAS